MRYPRMFCVSSGWNHFAVALGRRQGWRRVGAAFAFGLIAALALPPTDLFPVLGICFPALILLLRGAAGLRAAFITGWSFAFGYFLLGLYWIAAAMFVDLAHFWWAVPLAVAGLPTICALYYGLAAMVAWRIGLAGVRGVVTFALLWFLADYARGHLLTGFPWNLAGYVWDGFAPVLQSVSVIGIYGLTLLTLLITSLPAALVDGGRAARVALAVGVVTLGAISAWGGWRMESAAHEILSRVRIVQPNIDQARKWLASDRDKNFEHLLDLSATPAATPVSFIVWPETASTFYIAEDAASRYAIAARLNPGAFLLTGTLRREEDANGKLHYYNALVAVDDTARVVARYDKFHLVPFGEYIPFRSVLPLQALATLGMDFSAGDGPQTLRVEGLPSFSPQICYEAVFSGEVTNPTDRPQMLINLTNDGWYGHTAGPYQHFAIARVRAIEEGLPLIRAANTGISGVIDPYGHIHAKLGLGRTGFVDADVPAPLPPTLFSQWREGPSWILFALFAIGNLWARVRR